MKASELVELIQAHIAEHGDGEAQVVAHGNWLPVAEIKRFHGRMLIEHEKFDLMPFHRRNP